jgi:trehalose 6-phosphate phosphatase
MIQRRLPPFAPTWAFFLDVDGTLLEFAARPKDVHVDAKLRNMLAELSRLTGGAVALVSGRSIEDVDRIFQPLFLPAAAGLHGSERRSAAGSLRHQPKKMETYEDAASRIARIARTSPGLEFEDKGRALALHYRQAPHLRSPAEKIMREIKASLGTEFELQMGKFVVEVRPRGRNKGDAIAEFAAEPPFAGRVPVFVGDDLSDEAGFEVVNRLGGYSVKVGPGITRARWRLLNSAAVRQWLEAWIEYGSRGSTGARE